MDFNAYGKALSPRYRGAECPFQASEYEDRINRVRERMALEDFDALLVTDPSDIFYLTGYGTFEVSVHVALVVTHKDLMLQVPSIEMGPALTTTRVENISGYRWEGIGDVLEPLVQALTNGIETVAVDAWHGSLRTGVLDGLKVRLPTVRFVHNNGLLKKIRIVKSEAEIAYLRESARVTAAGLKAARAAVIPGTTDNDVAAAGARALIEAGSEFMSMQPIVTTGVRSSFIHCNHRRTVIEAGDPVFLEFGSAWYRYTAPMMQTVVAGGQPMVMCSGSMTAVVVSWMRCWLPFAPAFPLTKPPGRRKGRSSRWRMKSSFPAYLVIPWAPSFRHPGLRVPVLSPAVATRNFSRVWCFTCRSLGAPGRWGIGSSETIW